MNVTVTIGRGKNAEKKLFVLSNSAEKVLRGNWSEIAGWQAEEAISKQWKMVFKGLVQSGLYKANKSEDFFTRTKLGDQVREVVLTR